MNAQRLLMSPYIIFIATAASLCLGYSSKRPAAALPDLHAQLSAFASDILSCGYLLIWEALLFLIVIRRITTYTRQEELVLFRIREQYLKYKIEGKLNENSNEYRAKLQEMRDVSQPKQIVFKIVLSEYIAFSLIPSLLMTLTVFFLTLSSYHLQEKALVVSLKTIGICAGAYNSSVFISIRLRDNIPSPRAIFIYAVLAYALIASVSRLHTIGQHLADFYQLYHIVLWSCVITLSWSKFSRLKIFYGMRKALFSALQ